MQFFQCYALPRFIFEATNAFKQYLCRFEYAYLLFSKLIHFTWILPQRCVSRWIPMCTLHSPLTIWGNKSIRTDFWYIPNCACLGFSTNRVIAAIWFFMKGNGKLLQFLLPSGHNRAVYCTQNPCKQQCPGLVEFLQGWAGDRNHLASFPWWFTSTWSCKNACRFLKSIGYGPTSWVFERFSWLYF